MKFACSSTELLKKMQECNRVVSSKHTLPILDNILFELEGSKLTLRAADLETTIITRMEVEGFSDGAIAIPAKIVIDTLSMCSEQPITFDIDANTFNITLQTENGRFNVVGNDANDFPLPREIDAENVRFDISALTLTSIFDKVLFAAGDDEMRPVMNGVCFNRTKDKYEFVASDAHKLVRTILLSGIDNDSNEDFNFILNKKPANLLKTLLAKRDNLVQVVANEKNIRFDFEEYSVITSLVEGRYPNYNAVIPTNLTKKAVVNVIDFINNINIVKNFSNQASNLIKLSFKSDLLTITAQDIDYSISAEAKLACEFNGEPFEIGFKSTFLSEVLINVSKIDKECVVCHFTDANKAAIFEPYTQSEDKEILSLLMPMMLG